MSAPDYLHAPRLSPSRAPIALVKFNNLTTQPSPTLTSSQYSLFLARLLQLYPRPKMANNNSLVAKSNEEITKEEDKKMDAEVPSNGHVEPGISIRMGPVADDDKMDVDAPETNGKRKSRSSVTNGKSYKDASSSEDDDKPLVGRPERILYALQRANPPVEQAATDLRASETSQGRLRLRTQRRALEG